MSEMSRAPKMLMDAQAAGAVSPEVWAFLFKGLGSIAGSAISLAYLLPASRREAVLRLTVGVVAGLVFGAPVGVKIADWFEIAHLLSFADTNLMGAAAASLCAWGALGALVRFARSKGGL